MNCLAIIADVNNAEVRVGVAAVDADPNSIAWANCGGAIGLAIDRLRELSVIGNDIEFQMFIRHTTCNAPDAVGVALDLMKTANVDVVIAPPCHGGEIYHSHVKFIYLFIYKVYKECAQTKRTVNQEQRNETMVPRNRNSSFRHS
ncbi:unnamed protein product [Heligmosomoides polygyrus]|uniref:ANF_receptor domain-containing protein n=1 Tax=Heligmosomoides polygyrus TaxID=6339 RepID=A0A183GEU9_HELPZ|nr:unnamed protein product [Heligmosomoides polygyrus]